MPLVCSLCTTVRSSVYSTFLDRFIVCKRCALFFEEGPEASLQPGCPPVPADADPSIIDLQKQATDALTVEEFFRWINKHGNPSATVEDFFRDSMVGNKILEWFDDSQGGAIATSIEEVVIDFDLLQICASLVQPTKIVLDTLPLEQVHLLQQHGCNPPNLIRHVAEGIFSVETIHVFLETEKRKSQQKSC